MKIMKDAGFLASLLGIWVARDLGMVTMHALEGSKGLEG